MAFEITPQDYVPELMQEAESASLQEKADFQQKVAFENTANDLAARKNHISDVGIGTDEVVSLGRAKAEQRLSEVQQALYDCTDSTQSALLQIEAEQRAGLLTGSITEAKAPEPIQEDEVAPNIDDELIAIHGQEKVNEVLEWSGANLDQSTSEAINAHFASGHAEIAYQTLDNLHSNPELIHQGETTGFNEVEAQQLISEFGEHGSDLVTLNTMLSEGKVSKGKVLSHIMASPELMRTAYQAAQKGLLKFSV